MIDYELVLAEKQDFKAAVTTKAVDLGQKTPNIGLLERALWFVFVPSAVSAGTGSVTFTLEDSDDGTTFAPVSHTARLWPRRLCAMSRSRSRSTTAGMSALRRQLRVR